MIDESPFPGPKPELSGHEGRLVVGFRGLEVDGRSIDSEESKSSKTSCGLGADKKFNFDV